MGMPAAGGPSQQTLPSQPQHQQYMMMPAPMGNAYNPQQQQQQYMQQPGGAGNAYNPQQQAPAPQGQEAPQQQQAVYGMVYPTATAGAGYMQQPQQGQQMGGMPMMMPMQQQQAQMSMQGQQQPMYAQQTAAMTPQQQQYGGGMYQPAPSGQNNSRGGRNGKK